MSYTPVIETSVATAPGAGFGRIAATDLAEHRAAMLRFARRRVRDDALAEDAVQEALASALTSFDSFEGQSALRTWLIGILNHKIQDAFRRESRYVHPGMDGGGDDILDALSQAHDEPDARGGMDPAIEVARWRLGEALGEAIEALPPTLGEVFKRQILEGQSTEEVCDALGISESNCWVRLHRARKRLALQVQGHLN
ncbi:MAG: sigma-70 family RNA polymerase sigma factor [Burkholderiaceae bacterium]